MLTSPTTRNLTRLSGLCLSGMVLGSAMLAATGCGSSGRAPRPIERPVITRDVPPALQGTIGSMSTLRNAEPSIVAGYGIVIGLKDTGSTPERVDVAETVRRNLDKAGVSATSQHFKGTRYEGMTPEQIINDKSTSLVVVIASIPPGIPDGETFDVFVSTLPGSSTLSLEGGQLLDTDLRLGRAAVFQALQPKLLGVAAGAVYVNPFVSDGTLRSDGSGRTGRVLGGGRATEPLAIQLMLDNPDYLRARAFEQSINARFPRSTFDRQPAARGKNDSLVELHVPFAYRDRAAEFVYLVQHMQPDTAGATEYAQRYIRTLKEQPGLAVSMSWCLEAVGPAALPQIRTMYDYGEHLPRMAALRWARVWAISRPYRI
ncbi:MAG: flagellar basal body P-ring protein FlgI [Phycisphaerales bacterium]